MIFQTAMNFIHELMDGGRASRPPITRMVTPEDKHSPHDDALHLAQYVLESQYEPKNQRIANSANGSPVSLRKRSTISFSILGCEAALAAYPCRSVGTIKCKILDANQG
jgi:hypothetical protein